MKKICIKFNRKSGFTLVEIIISIGIVAILSSSILELFITAGNLNQKAYDMDKSVMLSETVVEQFKQLKTPEEIAKMAVLQDAYQLKSSKKNSYTIFYDKNWNVIRKDVSGTVSDEDVIHDASFVFNIYVTEMDRSGIMKVSLSVIKNKFGYMEKKTDRDFYAINIAKYFGGVKVD